MDLITVIIPIYKAEEYLDRLGVLESTSNSNNTNTREGEKLQWQI